MNKKELDNKIREKRNQMFPESMELKFGCEVILDFGGIVIVGNEYSLYGDYVSVSSMNTSHKIIKILGQKVTIIDVLRMVEKKYGFGNFIHKDMKDYDGYTFTARYFTFNLDSNGGLHCYPVAHNGTPQWNGDLILNEDLDIKFDLSKGDNFEDQEEEVRLAIWEIIK